MTRKWDEFQATVYSGSIGDCNAQNLNACYWELYLQPSTSIVSKGNVWVFVFFTKIQLKKRSQWNSHKLISLTANRATQSHTNTLQTCLGPSLSLAQQIWLCTHSLGAFTVQQWADSHHPSKHCVTVKKEKEKRKCSSEEIHNER